MRFSIFLPPQVEERPGPALVYLSGMLCTEENFTVKAGAYRTAAQLGLVMVAPDTSPRGDDVPDAPEKKVGKSASFYVDARQEPWVRHYQMETYITHELHALVLQHFPVAADRVGICGHSMGGHGALTLALRHPGLYRSVSALAPVCAPSLGSRGERVFGTLLGPDRALWAEHDACELLRTSSVRLPPLLIDQGEADELLPTLNTDRLAAVCAAVGQPLQLRYQPGYDHGYFFVQTFIDDHLRHHAAS